MSGGSYDYAYGRIEELASAIRARSNDRTDRRVFASLLDVCAKAARAIEWVDSCDYGPGDETAPIRAALAFNGGNPDAMIKRDAIERVVEILRAAGFEVTP